MTNHVHLINKQIEARVRLKLHLPNVAHAAQTDTQHALHAAILLAVQPLPTA